MIRIRHYRHVMTRDGQLHMAESLWAWLKATYGPSPEGVRVQVLAIRDGRYEDITGNVQAVKANDADEYAVLESPGGQAVLANIAISFILGLVAQMLAPDPEMPANVNRTSASPNNALGQRENQVRVRQRVEDIYGTVKAIPSLMMQTYTRYVSHEQYEVGYYCISRGYCDAYDVRDGDTLIEDIPGAGVAVYHPFTSPNSGSPVFTLGSPIIDTVPTVRRAIEVDGITLKAANQINLPATDDYTFTPDVGGDKITQGSKKPNFLAVVEVGDTITVTMTPQVFGGTGASDAGGGVDYFVDTGALGLFDGFAVGDSVTVSGFTDPANNGTFTIIAIISAEIIEVSGGPLVLETGATATYSVTTDYSGIYTAAAVEDGTITLSTSTWNKALEVNSSVSNGTESEWTSWITLLDADRTEVWLNLIAPQGMYKDDGGQSVALVEFEAEIEELDGSLDPTGNVEVVAGSLSGAVSNQRSDTIQQTTSWTGPARIRMRRTTPYDYDFSGTVVDEIKWADLYSVSPVDKPHFGNKTTIHTVRKATPRATAVKTPQLNCIASRLLPTYNGSVWSGVLNSDGSIASGTIHATSKIVDILMAVAIDPRIGNRSASEIDLAQIWAVQQLLDAWHSEVGQFNYTFDDDGMSFEETVLAIANAGFCYPYRQNGKIRLAYDRAQTNSVTLFSKHNKRPDAETRTRTFANDSEYDGVEFVYVDPDSNQSETIELPLDGSATKLKRFEIPGIRSFAQAWFRANREYARLLNQRLLVELETTMDARALLPNSRIDIADGTRFQAYNGEVVGYEVTSDGPVLTLSEDVVFTSGSHSIVLVKRDGSLQVIAATAVDGEPNQVLLDETPAETVITTPDPEDGIRTMYSFSADDDRPAMAFLVQSIDLSDGQYAKIQAANYSPAYYAADIEAVPDKATIIN